MGTFVVYILAAVLVLGVLIFVHELGHFLVAKASGVRVLRFSLGFGPKIVGTRVGETEYVVSLVPLGGYVKMLGEDDDGEASEDVADQARSFAQQPLYKRFAIVFAGPFSNLASSWACLVVVALFYGIPVPSNLPAVGALIHGLPAEKAGLLANDRILSVNDEEISTWDQLVEHTVGSKGNAMALKVKRGDAVVDVTVVPEKQATLNIFGENRRGGVPHRHRASRGHPGRGGDPGSLARGEAGLLLFRADRALARQDGARQDLGA